MHHYDIYPKVVEIHREVEISVKPLDGSKFSNEKHVILLTEMNNRHSSIMLDVSPDNGILRFTHTFQNEGVYSVTFENALLCVYALEADLHRCRPYIGDLHAHTSYVDGKESPGVVAANYRKAGFDFLAITEHRMFEPSVEAIEVFKDVPHDLYLLTGEEVHPPGLDYHIIHFGGDFSINRIFRDNPDAFQREVDEIEKTLCLPDNIKSRSREYAMSMWVYNKIREANGCSVMVHTHWIQQPGFYHKPAAFALYEMKEKPFDAFELIGGNNIVDDKQGFQNQMQISMWCQLREDGYFIPPVGSSDSHGTVNCDYNFFQLGKTMLFCEKLEKNSIIEAIRDNRSVALEQYNEGDAPRCYGKHRYAEFAMFLLSEFFPIHDELCYEEGRLMKACLCGDTEAKSILVLLSGRTAKLFDKYWA